LGVGVDLLLRRNDVVIELTLYRRFSVKEHSGSVDISTELSTSGIAVVFVVPRSAGSGLFDAVLVDCGGLNGGDNSVLASQTDVPAL
jgi:hypothetical protein